jgi:hypothetical protein
MSITAYSKYRRMKLRAAWELAGMAVWCKETGKYLAAFLLALILVQYITDTAIAADDACLAKTEAERTAEKQEQAWLSCLNNRGVWIDGVLHICTLADTRLAKGDFK